MYVGIGVCCLCRRCERCPGVSIKFLCSFWQFLIAVPLISNDGTGVGQLYPSYYEILLTEKYTLSRVPRKTCLLLCKNLHLGAAAWLYKVFEVCRSGTRDSGFPSLLDRRYFMLLSRRPWDSAFPKCNTCDGLEISKRPLLLHVTQARQIPCECQSDTAPPSGAWGNAMLLCAENQDSTSVSPPSRSSSPQFSASRKSCENWNAGLFLPSSSMSSMRIAQQ